MTYTHWQAAPAMRAVVGGVGLALVAVSLFWEHSLAIGVTGLLVIGMAIAFHGMGTQIEGRILRIWLGPGWIRKELSLENILDSSVVRNPWWLGWGIRYFGGGWMWCVSGLTAVELELQDRSRFRIGTDDPESLRKAIEGARSLQPDDPSAGAAPA